MTLAATPTHEVFNQVPPLADVNLFETNAALRDAVRPVTFTVLDEMVDGVRYAERHVIELVRHEGERIAQEVYVFAERDQDGRFVRIEEAAVDVTGP